MSSDGLGQRTEFQALFDNISGVVLWTTSEEEGFDYLSSGFEDIWGLPPETVNDDDFRFLDHIHPDDRDYVRSLVEQPPDEITAESYQCRVVRPDGTERWVQARQMPIRDDSGNVTEVIGISADITEQKRREAELERQTERLEEFASIVSHDLRNPLNVASGRLELARAAGDSEHLNAVAQAHNRMEAMIADLLTLAQNGQRVDDLSAVEMEAITTHAWNNVETKDATIVTDFDGTITADRSRLLQLLENLIRNAVEHGGATVTVTVGELDGGFYVEDDGPGVPNADREAIFDSGYSTDDGGTGFGLAIVKQVVDAHGWDIDLVGGSDGGARFEITASTGSNA